VATIGVHLSYPDMCSQNSIIIVNPIEILPLGIVT